MIMDRLTDHVGEAVAGAAGVSDWGGATAHSVVADRVQHKFDAKVRDAVATVEMQHLSPLHATGSPKRVKTVHVQQLTRVHVSKVGSAFMLVVIVSLVNSCAAVWSQMGKATAPGVPSWLHYLPIPGIVVNIVTMIFMYGALAEIDRKCGQFIMCAVLTSGVSCLLLPWLMGELYVNTAPAIRLWRFKKSEAGKCVAGLVAVCHGVQLGWELAAGTFMYQRVVALGAEGLGVLLCDMCLNIPDIIKSCTSTYEEYSSIA